MSRQGYVLGPDEGEQLVRNAGHVLIKADPAHGSDKMALGTQQIPPGTGIKVHHHFESDEVLYILDGTGFAILGDARLSVEKGSTVFIPSGTWHGIENPDGELHLLWIVTPTGLHEFFREVSDRPGEAPRNLTKEQINDIARKYGSEFR